MLITGSGGSDVLRNPARHARPHIRIFVNRERVAGIACPLRAGDEVKILQALSGG